MRALSRICVASLICLGIPAVAVCAEGAKPARPNPIGPIPVTMTPDQLKWTPNPGAPEVKTAVLWGDMDTGPHGAFHKFPAGFAVPLHTHSADQRVIVLSGTMSMTGEDGKELKFPPGSYYTQPHTFKHITKCNAGAECLVLVVATGKFDLHLVGEEKAVEKAEEKK